MIPCNLDSTRRACEALGPDYDVVYGDRDATVTLVPYEVRAARRESEIEKAAAKQRRDDERAASKKARTETKSAARRYARR